MARQYGLWTPLGPVDINETGSRQANVAGVDLNETQSTSVTGTLAATEGADTLAASGLVTVTGTLSATEGADTASFTGLVTVTGTLAATEGADAAAFTGSVTLPSITGTLEATEGADSASFTGSNGATATEAHPGHRASLSAVRAYAKYVKAIGDRKRAWRAGEGSISDILKGVTAAEDDAARAQIARAKEAAQALPPSGPKNKLVDALAASLLAFEQRREEAGERAVTSLQEVVAARAAAQAEQDALLAFQAAEQEAIAAELAWRQRDDEEAAILLLCA